MERKMGSDNRTAALTLIELMIVAAGFAIILGATLLMFTSSHNAMRSADAYLQVQQEGRRALELMGRELREANHIDTESTSQDQDATNAQRLNFQIARGYDVAGCVANAVCWGNDTDNGGWVHYLRNGTQLLRCQSSASDTSISDYSDCRVLANDADAFSVDYVNASRTVSIDLHIEQDSDMLAGGTSTPGTLHTQVRLRNSS